jgi:SAM-dependent methyltransferase
LSTNGGHGIVFRVSAQHAPRGGRPRRIPLPEGSERPIDACINKIVPFRFSGEDMTFRLSHGLFSSFDIDEGTRLLLKTIAQRLDMETIGSILDVGCGVGVVGISLSRRLPAARALLQDRDCLAVEVARENAAANKAAAVSFGCGLAFSGTGGRLFDLVACNVPAKAGQPVIRSFFSGAAHHLAPGGTAAFVIVTPLAQLAEETAGTLGLAVTHREATKDYLVLHFRAGASPTSEQAGGLLEPYLRGRQAFSHEEVSWQADTAWSLPDFDTLGYRVQLALELAAGAKVGEDVLFWNPGQGHLPLGILAMKGRGVKRVRLASRDALELAITERNLGAAGWGTAGSSLLPFEARLKEAAPAGSIDFLCAVPHPVPRVPWQGDLAECAAEILKPGARLLVTGTSTELHRFLETARGFAAAESRKLYGFRAALLTRQ